MVSRLKIANIDASRDARRVPMENLVRAGVQAHGISALTGPGVILFAGHLGRGVTAWHLLARAALEDPPGDLAARSAQGGRSHRHPLPPLASTRSAKGM